MVDVTLSDIKRGDSFILACVYKENAVAVDLTPFTIRSQMRTQGGKLIEELTVTKDPDQTTNPGVFAITADNPPNAWPVGTLACDIEFTHGTTIRSSQTMLIPVVADVTQ